MRAKDGLGRYGETVAAAYLRGQGYLIVDRNWRCGEGEIDIVARDAGTLVVCEVKTRRGLGYGSPLEAVTPDKLRRLRRLAAILAASDPVASHGVRIDVIGVLARGRGAAEVVHVKGVG